MTSCGRQRFWDGDEGRPGERMNSCGRYGGYYSSKGGGLGLHNNKWQSLRLEQSLTEDWNPTTS